MFRKMVFFGMACGLVGLVACAGPIGKGQGDSCSSQDECGSDLTCQPIGGRSGDYCCPTPATASTNGNCKPANDGG
jgi:hypothetical protein